MTNPHEKALINVIKSKNEKRPKLEPQNPDSGKRQALRSGKVGDIGKVRADMK